MPFISEEFEEEGPDTESDIFIQTEGHIGEYMRAYQGGKAITSQYRVNDDDEWKAMKKEIREWMNVNGFWPSVWEVSDHGGYRLVRSLK